ncbi:MAG: site-specific DNA-methyltransferase [Nitrosomonadales bacterium]|nr:site-specific DNA-methyltransferase [Nitrosomonadales bacterium]
MADLLSQLEHLNEQQLRRLLVEHLTRQKLGLYWEANAIERDAALNADVVLPRLVEEWSCSPSVPSPQPSPDGRGSQLPSPSGGRAGDEGKHPLPPGEGWGEGDFVYRNLIIEGDNYDSLRLLRATHAGKIRVIYIDPPYNTGNKDWVYNDHYVNASDRWRHSQWLEFLYRRLTLARDLLTPDGVILVSINDENRARLEMLMDEVFPGMRLGTITWRTRQGSNADQQCFLSVDHEHVLVYGNEGFSFNGFEKSYEMYGNADSDPRGDWRTSNLTLGFSYKERPNLYYPLQDPATGVVYPPNPDRIWVYASRDRLKEGQTVQTKTMEEFIDPGQIIFPKDQRVETWNTMDELLAAIDRGDVPKSGKSPTLRRELPNLEFWLGRPVGFGRPQFKRYKADLRNQTQPLSSWIVPTFEDGNYEAENSFVSSTNQEGARVVAEIFGDRAFNYAKPLSLIKNLLSQATQPNDIVLDFFAGFGTTGQAVLELNAEDASTGSAQVGQRRFILCSSTEANSKEPDKNLCRDVCAERMRRVISGYGGKPGYTPEQGGEFAYLQLDKVDAADAHFEIDAAHAFQLLALKRLSVVRAATAGAVQRLGRVEDCELLVCNEVNAETIATLAAWPQQHGAARLAIYSTRPQTLSEQLAARGVEANCYSLMDALLSGQRGAA